MKVLFAVPYIYDQRYPEFTRNPTGFGLIMKQIYECVAKNSEAYLVSHVLTEGHDNILPHTMKDVLRHVRLKDIMQGVKWAIRYKQGLRDRVRFFYYCLNKGYIRNVIKRISPDVVHINSSGMQNRIYTEVCEEMKQKYVITLHGLLGLDDSVQIPTWEKDYEKALLLHCEEKNIPVTVISTGIKKRIEKHYLQKPSRTITVVTNGTDVTPATEEVYGDLREKYHIPENGKIAVAVGNICKNKNQLQLAEALALLLERRKDLFIFLCGRDVLGGELRQRVEALGVQSHMFELGFLPQAQLGSIYEQADLNILASVNDGFGLSIIEGFVYGLPTVTFADLDAIPDVYHEKAVVLCESRDTAAFANAIEKTMDTQWEAEAIRAHSKNFSLEKMAENYQWVYEKAAR